MKTRILFFCISCLLWASCENSRQNYVIEGTLPSVKYDGEWIYLVPMENAPGRVDSVKITNASFSFSGQGEEMRVLRLRHLLRIYIQELLVVTEPGTIHVKADSVGSVTGTPQNDALQKWKEGREKKQEAYHFIRTGLRNATGKDSLHLIQIRDSLRMQEQEANFLFLKEQGNNTLGTFMRKMVRGSLTEEQQKLLDESLQKEYIEWGAAGIGALALFLFFFRILPYHLFHREQTQLFLLATEPLAGYLRHPAALARLSGDFLTQFFYYEGGGPAIMAVVLLLWGVVVFRLLVPYMGRWAWVPTVLAVAWEAGRQCGLSYPLSGTIALTGIGGVLLLCRSCMRRSWKSGLPVSILAVLSGYWLFGCGDWSSRWYNMPDLGREYLLALDSEMYFGRSEKVRKLLAEGEYRSPFTAYYYNLLNAQQNRLPDRLMDGYQPASQGLFLPVAPHSTYLTIYAANEVWFALGDMTMAEHAAILGMIFSPHHTGARAVKRLAEINLVNGDEAAAMKYLRLLQKTMCYRDWAERRIPGKQTAEVCQWLERKRLLLPATDTLRSSADIPLSLRHLLRNNPDNTLACDYLLCFDLLNKDIGAFAGDYREFAAKKFPSRLYAEGLLIYLAGKKASLDEVEKWNIPPQVLDEFSEYTRLYEANDGNGAPLQAKYGKTYWFYFHYATMKKGK